MHDVVVVGAGITGAWTAKQLADAGMSVLLLDAGPRISVDDACNTGSWTQERRTEAALRQAVQSLHPAYALNNPKLFVDDLEHPYSTIEGLPYQWIRGRQVGGRSLTWGGITLRMSDYELGAPDADGFGASWPIRYADLAQFYVGAERSLGVAGSREEISVLPDGTFLPAMPLTAAESAFKRAVESRWHDRRVIHCRGVAEEERGDDPTPSAWPRKCIQHRILPEALSTGRVELRTDTVVSSVVMENNAHSNRAVGLDCVQRVTGEPVHVPANVIVFCASTVESLRVLLNSTDDAHPRGICNSSGLLGKFLIDHAASWTSGRTASPPSRGASRAGGAHGILIPRFRNIEEPSGGFLRGYGIWGAAGRSEWEDSGFEAWHLCAMLEVLPRRENCVELARRHFDAWGISTPVFRFAYAENELRMLADAEAAIDEMVQLSGWSVERRGRMVPGGFVHELGGARMGKTPQSSVLTPHNQSWDVSNLFVLDGACFVTSGWQNPTLTMMAIAGRACAYIGAEVKAGHL